MIPRSSSFLWTRLWLCLAFSFVLDPLHAPTWRKRNAPLHKSSAVREKEEELLSNNAGWFQPPIPGVRKRRLRDLFPTVRLRRQRGPFLVCFACMAVVLTVILVSRGLGRTDWDQESSGEPPTLVFRREDLQRIWNWEIASGHFPSRQSIPKQIGLVDPPINPALPPKSRTISPSRYRPSSSVVVSADTDTLGVGPKRIYLDIQSTPPLVSYPPRPVPGSVADLDVVMKHCDFSQGKYVRDCLEVLRVGAGLDNGQRTRRGSIDDWKYIYIEEANSTTSNTADQQPEDPVLPPIYRPAAAAAKPKEDSDDPDVGLSRKRGAKWEPVVSLPPTLTHRPAASLPEPCDSDNPRVFHMFWTGPFTDKPYLALLSFLFTQNTGLHEPHDAPAPSVCRPQFWMWINPGPAAAIPNPNAMHDMFAQLKDSPWASPFLHPRFKDVIHFRLWNTTEQLDGVAEIRDEWRELQQKLFNSGGYVISVPEEEEEEETEAEEGEENTTVGTRPKKKGKGAADDMLHRTGSKSDEEYDALCHPLGHGALCTVPSFRWCISRRGYNSAARLGRALGWKGAFAYRWSRLEKYNTAMTVSRYTKDAYLEGLLLRLPDALFDGAWLNTEEYQRERPPQPYFTAFGDFFDTPELNSAAPQASASTERPSAVLITTTDAADADPGARRKVTFESYIRGERANMYGEWIVW
ncbi:hypothetical protein B0H13DRAFT_2064493 [Mycena leptocephala]|nr:hypothetical protein B0H13DRAFT_2064493 [Mycena leptocephala]